MFQRVRQSFSSHRIYGLLAAAFSLPILLSATPAFADPTTVTIGNSPSTLDGTYLHAQDIADNLVFTSILVQATTSVTVSDPIDMSTSTFGTPHFNLTLSAPVCNINANMNLSTLGHLFLTCGTLNLNGKITAGGADIAPSRVTGTATNVSVVSNSADIQQAIDVSSTTAPVLITVGAGQYTQNLTINRPLTLSGDISGNPIGAGPSAPTINGSVPSGNVITVTGNGAEVDGLHLSGVVNGGSSLPSIAGISATNVNGFTAVHNTLDGFAGPSIVTTGSTNVTLTANAPADQTILFTTLAPGNATVNGLTYTPSVSATSGLTAVITVDSSSTAGACSIDNNGVVSFQGAGTCVLDANQPGNSNYNAATQVQQSFTVHPAAVIVHVSGSQVYGSANPTFTFTATPPNGVTVNGTLVCTTVNEGTPISSALNVGSYILDAASCSGVSLSDATDYSLFYASSANDFVVGTANQTVAFTSTAPTNAAFGGSPYTPTAAASSGLPVTITVDSSAVSVCSISGGVVSYLSAGTCVLDANQSGNASFNAAPQVQQSFVVNSANQTVAFTSTAPSSAVVGGTAYIPSASATSNLPATITVDPSASSVCAISGGQVSFLSAGNCVLDANQAGSANYTAAPQVQQSFTVNPAPLSWSGFLQPINSDGSSIFKLGRTVPVKFQLTGASAGITNLQAKLYVTKETNNIDGTVVEAVSTAAADSGNTFRYDSAGQQYVFNMGTSSLTAGTYKLKIYVNGDNTTGTLLGTVTISLK